VSLGPGPWARDCQGISVPTGLQLGVQCTAIRRGLGLCSGLITPYNCLGSQLTTPKQIQTQVPAQAFLVLDLGNKACFVVSLTLLPRTESDSECLKAWSWGSAGSTVALGRKGCEV
jgi:hypothetical protein